MPMTEEKSRNNPLIKLGAIAFSFLALFFMSFHFLFNEFPLSCDVSIPYLIYTAIVYYKVQIVLMLLAIPTWFLFYGIKELCQDKILFKNIFGNESNSFNSKSCKGVFYPIGILGICGFEYFYFHRAGITFFISLGINSTAFVLFMAIESEPFCRFKPEIVSLCLFIFCFLCSATLSDPSKIGETLRKGGFGGGRPVQIITNKQNEDSIKGKLVWDTGKEFLILDEPKDGKSKSYQRIKYGDVYKVIYEGEEK